MNHTIQRILFSNSKTGSKLPYSRPTTESKTRTKSIIATVVTLLGIIITTTMHSTALASDDTVLQGESPSTIKLGPDTGSIDSGHYNPPNRHSGNSENGANDGAGDNGGKWEVEKYVVCINHSCYG
jgi:hypothetical protein